MELISGSIGIYTQICLTPKNMLLEHAVRLEKNRYLKVSHLVVSNSGTPRTAGCQASLSFTVSWSLLKLISIELVMPSNHFFLCCPLLLPSILPRVRVFSSESALHVRWPNYWRFSISPLNIHSEFISFRIDGLISLQSKRLPRIFSGTTIQKHQFSSAQLSLWSNSHIHT